MIFDDKPSAILVWIKIPGLELERTNPAWIINGFAGGVLQDLLSIELAAEMLLIDRPPSGPMPFLGWFLFEVADAQKAGAIVLDVLQRNGLDTWATILRYDADELIWRSIYPPGIGMLTEDVLAATGALADKCGEVLALWTQLLHRPNPSESHASKQ